MKRITTILLLAVAASNFSAAEVEEHYLEVKYDNRTLPIKVYAPKVSGSCPLIIYSHGLGGSCETKKYLLEHWAEAGFICVSVQHPGSDADVWKNAERGERFKAIKQAANAKQFLNRSKDIPAALDQLEKWNDEEKHVLHGKIDFTRVGMSGHSFGAITSQIMMGAKYRGLKDAADERFKAFLLMSPSPVKGVSPEAAFGHVTLPVLCMTGTEDKSVIQNGVGYKERVSVYNGLPEKNRYLYVFDGGKHNIFSGPTRFSRKMTEDHKLIQDLTLLFWQAHLKKDKEALKKLHDTKPHKGDEWLAPELPPDN